MSIKKNIHAWEIISKNYSKLLIPNRPSYDDCQIYGKLTRESLRNKKQPKIMVMGSTPELRRILYTAEFLQKAEVFCVDINQSMYRAMGNFLIKGNFNERFVNRSWLDTKFKEKTFDLVLGDEVICNISPNLHECLFKEISRIIKDDGAWITRHNFYTKDIKTANVSKILAKISEKIGKGEYDFQLAINLLYARIFYYSGWKNHKNNSMAGHLQLMKSEFNKNLNKHKYAKIIKELINLYEKSFLRLSGDYKWHVLSEEKSEEELKEYFIVGNKVYANDYLTIKNSPIYLLKKK